jgi:heptosyltransferase-2
MSKILAVRLSSLGDVVLTQPVVTALASAGHSVDFLTKPEYRALAEMFPGVAQVITSPDNLARDYALILDWHHTLRARSWISRLRPTKTISYSKHSLARRLLVRPGGRPMFWNAWPRLEANASVTDWYAQTAAQAGIAIKLNAPQLNVPAAAQQAARELLARSGQSAAEPWVAMSPGAKWPTKQWPLESYAALTAKLEEELGLRTVFLGATADAGVCQAARILAGGRALSLAGQTSIPVLAALLAQTRLLVCNDSGPMHLGVAAGTRVLAFFGPTVREFGFAPPASPRVRVLSRELSCRPCSVHGSRRCPLGHHDCLKKIATAEAWDVSKELLNLPR